MIVIIIKRIKRIFIICLVIAVTVFSSCLCVSAEEDLSNAVVDYYLIAGDFSSGFISVDCNISYQTVGDDLLVTLRPKDQLEFLIMIDKGYEFDLGLDLNNYNFNNIVFNNAMPITFTSSSETLVSPFVYSFNSNPMYATHACMFNFTAFQNMSEFSFALTNEFTFDFSAPPEPSGFMVFLSDVVILFENSLDWFNHLFSMVSDTAPLLVLVCGFVIVGFSFSLLRRVAR